MLRLLEKAFTLIALFFYSDALGRFIGETNPLAPIKEVFAYISFAIALVLLLSRLQSFAAAMTKDKLLWLLVLVTVVSPLWSDHPDDTLLKVIPFVRVTVFAAYFATRYSMREQIQMIAWVMGVAAIGSAVLAIAVPYYGVMGYGLITNMEQIVHQGTWRGVFIHKTILGTMMAVGVLASLFCLAKKSKPYWLNWLCLALTMALLLASTTRGALVFMLIVLCLVPFFRAMRWNYKLAIPFFIIIGLISSAILIFSVTNAEAILTAMGRNTTLSGRTIYWPLMIDEALDRPWLGYGYDAFWVGGWKGEPADIWQFLKDGDEPPHPHNGFLFVWLNTGLVGLSLFAMQWFTGCLRSIRWLWTVKTVEGLVPLAYLTLTILLNLTETMLMQPNILWILYVSASLSLAFKPSTVEHPSPVTADLEPA
jgi:exopolysaccharide production protein ExoQ